MCQLQQVIANRLHLFIDFIISLNFRFQSVKYIVLEYSSRRVFIGLRHSMKHCAQTTLYWNGAKIRQKKVSVLLVMLVKSARLSLYS